jgi:hypothetical protein
VVQAWKIQPELPQVSYMGILLKERWITEEPMKLFEKIANPQAFSVE